MNSDTRIATWILPLPLVAGLILGPGPVRDNLFALQALFAAIVTVVLWVRSIRNYNDLYGDHERLREQYQRLYEEHERLEVWCQIQDDKIELLKKRGSTT